MDLSLSTKEILQMAMSIEEEGVQFYKDLAKKIEGYPKTKLLEFAQEEEGHYVVFEQMYNQIDDGELEYLFDESVVSYFNQYAQEIAFSNRASNPKNLGDVLDAAMETEAKTIDFYVNLEKKAVGEKATVLRSIIDEEKSHVKKLKEFKDTYGYYPL